MAHNHVDKSFAVVATANFTVYLHLDNIGLPYTPKLSTDFSAIFLCKLLVFYKHKAGQHAHQYAGCIIPYALRCKGPSSGLGKGSKVNAHGRKGRSGSWGCKHGALFSITGQAAREAQKSSLHDPAA